MVASRQISSIDVAGIVLDSLKQSIDVDDTAAFNRAVTNGVPIYLRGRTYNISNMIVASAVTSLIIIGIPGQSVIKKSAANGSAFANIASPVVSLEGVTFDLNYNNFPADQWGVLVTGPLSQRVTVRKCVFKNHNGALGAGFVYRGSNPTVGGSFEFTNNEVTNCSWNGTFFGSVANGMISGNYVHDMVGAGILVTSYLSATSSNYSSDIIVTNNVVQRCGSTGIGVGGISSPYVYGTPSAKNVTISNNQIEDCVGYPIVGQGLNVSTLGNSVTNTPSFTQTVHGIQYTGQYGVIAQNNVNLSVGGGLDCGGCQYLDVIGNTFNAGSGGAINCGGTTACRISNNEIYVSGTAIGFTVQEMEGDGQGGIFPYACSGLVIENNTVTMDGGGTKGVQTYDNPGGRSGSAPMAIRNNEFFTKNGASDNNCLSLMSGGSGIRISGNRCNGNTFAFINPNAGGDIVVPDVYDGAYTFAGSASAIRGIVSPLIDQFGVGGSILWAYPTAGGSNYSPATTISFSGSGGGSGAAATVLLNQGQVVGIKTTANGSGYSGTITGTISDTGGGSGATISVVNTPVIPFDREITFSSTSVTNTVATGGGYIGINMPAPVIVSTLGALRLKWLGSASNKWTVLNSPDPVFAVGSLPAASAANNGAVVKVTGSTTGKWQARSNGSNWIWPDGTTVTT